IILKDWPWAYPTYSFEIDDSKGEVVSVSIDPNEFMADINRVNNTLTIDRETNEKD
ncbi:MAG: hypothetical protein HKO80_03570, partial [Flavobacteriaceae bacterium]|nr:hypothetical protein [Flavobacteriaceae bacterium]